jgi:hypothetical protein
MLKKSYITLYQLFDTCMRRMPELCYYEVFYMSLNKKLLPISYMTEINNKYLEYAFDEEENIPITLDEFIFYIKYTFFDENNKIIFL